MRLAFSAVAEAAVPVHRKVHQSDELAGNEGLVSPVAWLDVGGVGGVPDAYLPLIPFFLENIVLVEGGVRSDRLSPDCEIIPKRVVSVNRRSNMDHVIASVGSRGIWPVGADRRSSVCTILV